MRKLLIAATATFAFAVCAGAQQNERDAAAGPQVTIHLKDGSILIGVILREDQTSLAVRTGAGLEITVPRASVERVEAGARASGRALSDPNYSRLLFSPTGRPLRKGEGYFSDHYVVFPGVAYGITNHFSVGAGVSVVPGIGLDEQLFYVAPRVAGQVGSQFAVSAGFLWARGGDEAANLGLGFAVATHGAPEKSATLGLGIARTVEDEYHSELVGGRWTSVTRREVSHTPIVMFGGEARLSRRTALVSESWLILRDDFRWSEQPFGLGVRFFGERLSADVGVILVGEVLKEGFPVPWLSVSYSFGPSGAGRGRAGRTTIPLGAARPPKR
jgi:hypothetical protein